MNGFSKLAASLAGVASLAIASAALAAQAPPPPPPTAQAGAPGDLTGQWVSVVTEDWRWRMITPPKGDYASVPLNPEGRRVADTWDLAADNATGAQCKAFGIGGLTRLPGRIRISWQDDNTLKLETDAGQQTRLFRFANGARGDVTTDLRLPWTLTGERTWQGETKAQWFRQIQRRGLGFGGGPPPPGGALRAVTRNMRDGYLRKNGVPYSQDAVVTEQFNLHSDQIGGQWLTVTTIVDDPKYLATPFVTSTSFKKETDASKWNPTPCRTDPPLGKVAVPAEG